MVLARSTLRRTETKVGYCINIHTQRGNGKDVPHCIYLKVAIL